MVSVLLLSVISQNFKIPGFIPQTKHCIFDGTVIQITTEIHKETIIQRISGNNNGLNPVHIQIVVSQMRHQMIQGTAGIRCLKTDADLIRTTQSNTFFDSGLLAAGLSRILPE